jgi:hypothetical protein
MEGASTRGMQAIALLLDFDLLFLLAAGLAARHVLDD